MNDIKVQVKFRIYLTEKKDLLYRLEDLFNLQAAEIQKNEKKLYTIVTAQGSKELLHQIKKRIREMSLQERVEALFRENRRGKKSQILLDKQAAYVGAVGLISSRNESSLGPLILEVAWETEDEFDAFLGWLTSPQSL